MAYNQNFYNNFQGNNFTFQNQYARFSVPPPPPYIPAPYHSAPQMSDQEFIKTFEKNIPDIPKPKLNINISNVKGKLILLLSKHKELTEEYKSLKENVDNYTDSEWRSLMNIVGNKKNEINQLIAEFNSLCMEQARRYVVKRKAKRQRLKKQREVRRQEKSEWIKEMRERSRKIDENLQKIKDDILKSKKEEEEKLKADSVLKEVRRKKNDAKKFLIKLDAFTRLYQAKQNTAKGRGQNVSEKNAVAFEKNIAKLKELWIQRQECYTKEEIELQAKLSPANEPIDETNNDIDKNLAEWKEALFGGVNPQVNFGGNVEQFINVRRQWDAYISSDGSVLPIGWVV